MYKLLVRDGAFINDELLSRSTVDIEINCISLIYLVEIISFPRFALSGQQRQDSLASFMRITNHLFHISPLTPLLFELKFSLIPFNNYTLKILLLRNFILKLVEFYVI